MGRSVQIEQKTELERRLGVSINKIGARTRNDDDFEVVFELLVLNGDKLQTDISVVALLYDYSGNLLARDEAYVSAEKVFAFTSGFMYFFGITSDDVKKIVIYPEVGSN